MAKSDVLVRMKADTQNYDANIAKARRQLDQFRKDNLSLGGVLKQTSSSLLGMAAQYASVAAAIGAVGAAIKGNIDTARGFEKSMSQLSSLTGMVGDDLNKLKEYAIELGSTTTLSASEVADAFKMIGSQQPQLLASGEALKAVTKNAITLAEAAGIDLATASQTLSTSINQMGGDSNNAERYINVLAAAAQNGAGDIAWLGEAITKSGTTAKAVGTDYEELVANLEQLAKAGFDASTAGTALRSIIMNLEKQANNDFKPSIVGLTQAFENLGKANLSIVGYQEIAGKMFASQAKALADAAGEAKNMTAAITGTNTAEEQAKTNTDNLEGSIKSLSSAWEGFNLHLNSSNGLFRDIVDGLKDIVVWADNVIVKLGEIPNPENIITKSLQEVGSNIDDKGNYIKRPAQKGAAGFDWDNGTWKPGYSGAIYNSATGQTELPEITVAGTKRTKPTPKKENKKTVKEEKDDFEEIIGLIPNAEEAVRSLQQQISESWDEGEIEKLTKKLEVAQKELQRLKDIGKPKELANGISGFNAQTMGVWMSGRQSDLSKAAYGSSDYNSIVSNIADMETIKSIMEQRMKAGVNAVDTDGIMESLWERVFDGENIPNDVWQSMVDAINEKLNEMNIQPIKINFETGKMEPVISDVDKLKKTISMTASVVGTIGQAFNAIEDPAAKVASIVAQAIANIALAYSQALAKDVGSKFNIFGFIAASASAMISMATTIASIHQATGYAEGGIVKGNSYSGDNMMFGGDGLYGLNAGELVLTKAQQGNLAQSLQNNGQTIRVVGKIAGKDLFICAENWAKSVGKGEFVTW